MYFYLLSIILISCNKSDSVEDRNLSDKISGEWIEISPCEGCNTLTFSNKDTIYLKKQSDPKIYKMFYQLKSTDIIEVTRLWEIEDSKKTSSHKIENSSDNVLFLEQFMPVDYGTTGFDDITLTKSN